MTLDATESLLLHERNMLYTYAIECNPNISKGKTSVYFSFIVEI